MSYVSYGCRTPLTQTCPRSRSRQVWGTESGGYADELRLKSSPPTDEDGNGTYINLRAHGGSLDFENTKVKETETNTQHARSMLALSVCSSFAS